MRSSELFKQVIYPCNCKYGSPMGRASKDTRTEIKKERFFDRAVTLDKGGYDRGGAYWGVGNNVRVMYNQDLNYIRFYNAYKPCQKVVKASKITNDNHFAPVVLWDK